MKRMILRLVIFTIALSALAQGPHPHLFSEDDDFELRPPPPRQGHPPPEFGPHSYAMKWLEQLSKDDPSEYERLQQLRHKDPGAFRQELHRVLKRERATKGLRRFPRIMEALQELPEDKRDELLEQLRMLSDSPEKSRRYGRRAGTPFPAGPEGEPPEAGMGGTREELDDLAHAYRIETDPEARLAIASQMRERLARLFDARNEARVRHIERIEHDLAGLKENLAYRRSMRSTIVERRLRELIDENPDSP